MSATQANGECHLRFGARTVSRARVILVGGLIAAALDITYACIVYGPLSFHLSRTEVLQSVASGWVGNDAAAPAVSKTWSTGKALRSFVVTLMFFFSLAIAQSPAFADDYPITPNAPIKPMEMVLIKGGC